MADDLERKAVREELSNNGFKIRKIIANSQLPASLTNILIELAKGKYQEVRIIPGDRIVETAEWRLEQPSHAVYVKDNPECKPSAGYLIIRGRNRQTGEYEHRRVI